MQQMVTGQVGTLEQRQSGWVAVHINVPGRQYPVKLSTKKTEIIGQAQSMQGQMVDALYNEVTGDSINPHTNQPYINRYLEALAPAGQMGPVQQQVMQEPAQQGFQPMSQLVPQNMPVQQPSQQWQQPVQQPVPQQPQVPAGVVTDTDREGRIMRQSAAKVAAELIQHRPLEERTIRTLVATSEQLVKYFRDGVSWTTNGPEYEPGADDGDPDGIPF